MSAVDRIGASPARGETERGRREVEEAGVHIEYLCQLGELAIANLDEVARSENPVLYDRTRR